MHDVDVFVPVLGRAHTAAPFMESLAASECPAARVIAVYSPWDDQAVPDSWRAAGAKVLACPGKPGSFAQKINHAYYATGGKDWGYQMGDPAPWMLLVGDDVRFHPRWFQHARACAAAHSAQVVGTNTLGPVPDGGTPHPLVWRPYVDKYGASWDGPGVVCHEGYRHNYVDVEIAKLAIDRGWFHHCQTAVVEHLCPYQGKADQDRTYEISSQTVDSDRALWGRREQAINASYAGPLPAAARRSRAPVA